MPTSGYVHSRFTISLSGNSLSCSAAFKTAPVPERCLTTFDSIPPCESSRKLPLITKMSEYFRLSRDNLRAFGEAFFYFDEGVLDFQEHRYDVRIKLGAGTGFDHGAGDGYDRVRKERAFSRKTPIVKPAARRLPRVPAIVG